MAPAAIVPIPTFVVNLKTRPDRRQHVLSEFRERSEFDLIIIDAETNEIGAVGLWNTIRKIFVNCLQSNVDYVLLCEDDHLFTSDYCVETLFECISEAKSLNAEIVLGGVSSVESIIPVAKKMVWVERFTGLQFTIVFRDFFQKIVLANFSPEDAADYKFSELSERKFLIFPFMSIQKEFGYSDATPTRTRFSDDVTSFFKSSSQSIMQVLEGWSYYGSTTDETRKQDDVNSHEDDFTIKTYIVAKLGEEEQMQQARCRLETLKEFDLVPVNADGKNEVDIWRGIRKAVQEALVDEEDVIVICDVNHNFTQHYVNHVFYDSIINSYQRGADILLGNTSGNFNFAIVAGSGTFWINKFTDSHFIVVYRKFFQKIIDAPFENISCYKSLLSSLTNAKIAMHPFISDEVHCSEMGDSCGSTNESNMETNTLSTFAKADVRLTGIRKAFNEYSDRYVY